MKRPKLYGSDLALTNFIEYVSQKGMKTAVVFIDLLAAYDTVWKKGLLREGSSMSSIPNLISNMLSDHYFQVALNEDTSTVKKLNDGLPKAQYWHRSCLTCI